MPVAPGLSLPFAFARRHGVVVVGTAEPSAPVAVGLMEGADPLALVEVRRLAGRALHVRTLDRAAFERALTEAYADVAGTGAAGIAEAELGGAEGLSGLLDQMPGMEDLLDANDDGPVIRLINGLITEAARAGASDIHIEPFDTHVAVRLRADGVLREAARFNPRLAPLIVSRIKVMARLDIAERRLPQDGRISLALAGRAIDVRVSTLPAKAGERVVMRLLDREQRGLGLEDLGMAPAVLSAYRAALKEPNGIVLVTGPTGAGKTTTLYAGLRQLNDGSRSILTVEDPVEYAVEGVGQTQVNPKVGLTFAQGLRAILRQDPDIVMVGEIRDAETAQIAVQASLTGHLVLSTVHTNDALGALVRLRDFGVEPFLLASTVRVVLAQRLVRRLCPSCRQPFALDPATARLVGVPEGTTAWRAAGCQACGGTGYQGRVGVHEAIRVDEALRRLIAGGAPEAEMAALAFGPDSPAQPLAVAARDLVTSGVTSVEEALRIIRPEGAAHAGL
jgi:general secretion pathway protein E